MGDNAGDATATEKNNSDGESHRYYVSRKTLLLMLKDRGYNISDSDINLTFTQFRDRHWTCTNVDRFQISASHLTDSNNKVLAVFCDTGVVRLDTIRFMSNRIRIYNKESLSRLIIVVQSRITTPAMKAIADRFACKVEIFQMTDLLVNYTTKHELKPSHVVVPDKVKVKEKEKLVFKLNRDALKVNLDAKQGLQAPAPVVKGVEKSSESPGGHLEKTFGDSVTTVVDKDKGKRNKGVEKICESSVEYLAELFGDSVTTVAEKDKGKHNKGVKKNDESSVEYLDELFGGSVTTVADKSKRKIELSEIKSPDSKRNKLMAMFNQNRKGTDVSKKVIERPVTEIRVEKMVPVSHAKKLVEVAALKPVVQTGDKQGSKSGDAVVGSSTVAHVQEQTNKDISNAVTTALATLVSHCPEICQRLDLHEKQSGQVMAEKRKAEAEAEHLEKLVADLKQSCSAETLLRMKTELELSEMKKKFITDQEKHAMNFHEKDMAFNEARGN
ncbi:uncharacterized protein LOC143608440 [Bidens hawaiensis]|uniref:uncharacterized protein LOC143608440 n=1 Tax=Bidens hawaiensis TaxID=980011 RepID=UPI00404A67EA